MIIKRMIDGELVKVTKLKSKLSCDGGRVFDITASEYVGRVEGLLESKGKFFSKRMLKDMHGKQYFRLIAFDIFDGELCLLIYPMGIIIN